MAMQQGSDDPTWRALYALFDFLLFPLLVLEIKVFYIP